jgi:hypothetical protein
MSLVRCRWGRLCAGGWPILLSAVSVSPASAETWDPGRRTTATVDDEVIPAEPGGAGDGVYGRFDGDLALGVGLGAELGQNTRAAARLSLHYFYMAGVYASYRDTLSGRSDEADTSDDARAALAARVLSFGIDLRPAFIPRWSRSYEQGPSFLDLALDSISLGMGAFFAEPPGGALGDGRGFELSLGFGLPIVGQASGPWLEARGLLSLPDAGESSTTTALVLLSWHTLFDSPLARAVN